MRVDHDGDFADNADIVSHPGQRCRHRRTRRAPISFVFRCRCRSRRLARLVGGEMRAAIIVNALDHRAAARAQWLESQAAKLRALGFTVQELDLRQFFGARDRLSEALQRFDAVWVNGGNAFILRRAMRQSGCDLLLADLLERDRLVYAGFSAAAVIASSTLRALDRVSDPAEVPPGYDPAVVWDGLGFLPFSTGRTLRVRSSRVGRGRRGSGVLQASPDAIPDTPGRRGHGDRWHSQ